MSASSTNRGVVVGVDGSPASDAAVRWASHDVAMRKTALIVVHMVEPALT
jgi:nucleotide-binding universal stress UspA family protein